MPALWHLPRLKTLLALLPIPISTVLAVLAVSATVASPFLSFLQSWTARFLPRAHSFFRAHQCFLPYFTCVFHLKFWQVFECVQARFKTKIEELPEEIDTSSYMPRAGVVGGSEFLG